ncbi:MAG: Purine catabolism regulatory protein [Stenotrophomonas maltophilia]|nr:MAG: Purine catabolism regulatory protein [Stenotrophomonas maltophilia]
MKLATALQQTILQQATVVAGRDALERDIHWVQIVDHPEITNWLKPGDLLLTTGYNWPEDQAASRQLIRHLQQLGLVGVVLAVPHFREHFPPEALEEADRCGFALLELPWDIPFSQITHEILAKIINLQTEIIQRADLIHRTLTSAALAADNLDCLVEALTRALQRPALIVGPAGEPLSGSSDAARTQRERALLRSWLQRGSLAALFEAQETRVLEVPGAGVRLGCPIRLQGEVAGVVWLESAQDDFEELDARALEHAAVIAALHLSHQRELSDQETRLGHAFVAGLLEGQFSATPSAMERARVSGWNEAHDYRVCLLLLDEPIPLSLDGFNRRRQRAERIVAALRALAVPPLLSVSLNQISVLLPVEVEPATLWRQLRGDGGALAVSRVQRGVAGMARGAQDVAALLDELRPGELRSFETVLFPRALMGDADARRLLLEQLIGPLAEHKRGESLLETLCALSREGYQLANSARALNIHISTLRYRIERIEALLGVSLEAPATRFQLQVATELYRLECPEAFL